MTNYLSLLSIRYDKKTCIPDCNCVRIEGKPLLSTVTETEFRLEVTISLSRKGLWFQVYEEQPLHICLIREDEGNGELIK